MSFLWKRTAVTLPPDSLSGLWQGDFSVFDDEDNLVEITRWHECHLSFASGKISGKGTSVYECNKRKLQIRVPFTVNGTAKSETGAKDSFTVELVKQNSSDVIKNRVVFTAVLRITRGKVVLCTIEGNITPLEKLRGQRGKLCLQRVRTTADDGKDAIQPAAEAVAASDSSDSTSAASAKSHAGDDIPSSGAKTVAKSASPTVSVATSAVASASSAAVPPPPPDGAAASTTTHPFGFIPMGTSVQKKGEGKSDCGYWEPLNGTEFVVRQCDYALNREKARSAPSLYDLWDINGFLCPCKQDFLSPFVRFPDNLIEPAVAREMETLPGLPHIVLCNLLFPLYCSGNPLTTAEDGKGFVFLIAFKVGKNAIQSYKEACAAKASGTEPTASQSRRWQPAQLLSKWVADADKPESDRAYADRMKFIARFCNIDDVSLPYVVKKLLATWNEKPVLGRPQLHHANFKIGGYRVFEIVLDVHRFKYFALRGLSSFLPKIKECVLNLAVLVEGRGEEEEPEQILGCVKLEKVDTTKLVQLPWFPTIA